MYRTIAVVLLASSNLIGQVGGTHTCVVDGLKYMTVQAAVAECAGGGLVVIPPTYAGEEPSASPNVMDFRHAERVKGLTPVTEFGVKGDAVAGSNGASEIGSASFTAASAAFSSGRDVGKAIVITGAGPENASLTTTIKTVVSPTRVTLAAPAEFTAGNLTYWYGSDNTSALQAAYKSGKPLFLPPGRYLLTGTVKGATPLFLTGAGAESVLIDDTALFDVHGTGGHYLDNLRLQAATKLTAVAPNGFPTPHAGTPVAVDRQGAGVGYQPEPGDKDIWAKASKQQQAQRIGPTLTMSSDGIHIYRITGDLVSILLFDVQFSEVALCDFRGGRNFVGGIALWHTPKNGQMNRQDSIHNNTVRYASFSGIVWAAAEKVSIRHNVVEFSGESGFKNYSSQGDGTYNTEILVDNNHSEHNHYDGLDLSETYPHTGTQRTSSVVSGNLSAFNDRTGAFGDGVGWKLIYNAFENNGLAGMSLDMSDSTISGNTLTHNNRLHDRSAHQIILGPGVASRNNVIEQNRITAEAAEGSAIFWSAASSGNQISNNVATGGAVFKFEAPPASSHGNSDSRGRYPDR
jgi:hypothetical protein